MKKSMNRGVYTVVSSLLVCVMLTGCASDTPVSDLSQNVESEVEESYIDTLTPASDFYGYINAEELMKMELEPTQLEIGTLDEPGIEANDALDEIVKEIVNSKEEFEVGSNEQLIRDAYNQVYDQLSGKVDYDDEDTVFVDGIVSKVESAGSIDELIDVWNYLSTEYGYNPCVSVQIYPNLNDKDEYILLAGFSTPVDLETLTTSQISAIKIRDQISKYIKTLGIPADEVKARSTDLIYMLYEIGGHTDFDILNGDKEPYEYYNEYSAKEYEEAFSGLSYDDLFNVIGYEGANPDSVVIQDPDQFATICSLLDDEHLSEWKDYTIYTFMDLHSAWLPDKYAIDTMEISDVEEYSRAIVKKVLKFQLGEEYAERYLDEEKVENITKMLEDMRDEYRVLIDDADWLTDEGKTFLNRKLDYMEFYVGADEPSGLHPEYVEYLGNSILKTRFLFESAELESKYDTLKKGRDAVKPFYFMNTYESNACYIPTMNCVVIPVAIMNEPVYNPKDDYATNLGKIGTILGHEISHAFDSNGILYDEYGLYKPENMPEADREAFAEIQERCVEYYDTFTVLGSHVNGRKTLAENLADLSGVQCALALVDTKEEKQEVLESYAYLWSELIVDSYAKENLEYDCHSPSEVRVNAAVACFDEYYEIYDVKEGDAMYVAPEDRVRRW